MGDTTGFLLYVVTVVVLAGSVVLADITRSVTVTESLVSVRILGVTVSVPVGEVRRVAVENHAGGNARVVVVGRRPWQSVRIETAAGSGEARTLEAFLRTAESLGAPVTAVPAQAA
ncbi:MAG: hypothetical protein ACKOFF_07050 [Acidimicrobiales bacterium]